MLVQCSFVQIKQNVPDLVGCGFVIGWTLLKTEAVFSAGMSFQGIGYIVSIQLRSKVGNDEVLDVGIVLSKSKVEFCVDLVSEQVR